MNLDNKKPKLTILKKEKVAKRVSNQPRRHVAFMQDFINADPDTKKKLEEKTKGQLPKIDFNKRPEPIHFEEHANFKEVAPDPELNLGVAEGFRVGKIVVKNKEAQVRKMRKLEVLAAKVDHKKNKSSAVPVTDYGSTHKGRLISNSENGTVTAASYEIDESKSKAFVNQRVDRFKSKSTERKKNRNDFMRQKKLDEQDESFADQFPEKDEEESKTYTEGELLHQGIKKNSYEVFETAEDESLENKQSPQELTRDEDLRHLIEEQARDAIKDNTKIQTVDLEKEFAKEKIDKIRFDFDKINTTMWTVGSIDTEKNIVEIRGNVRNPEGKKLILKKKVGVRDIERQNPGFMKKHGLTKAVSENKPNVFQSVVNIFKPKKPETVPPVEPVKKPEIKKTKDETLNEDPNIVSLEKYGNEVFFEKLKQITKTTEEESKMNISQNERLTDVLKEIDVVPKKDAPRSCLLYTSDAADE